MAADQWEMSQDCRFWVSLNNLTAMPCLIALEGHVQNNALSRHGATRGGSPVGRLTASAC
jgi:hypothetical protein